MRHFGQLLLWLGFLSGSLATVCRLPADGVKYAKELKPEREVRLEFPDRSEIVVGQDGWHLIPWVWFGISAAICVVGVVMIRVGLASSAAANDDIHNDIEELRRTLCSLIENTRKLGNTISSMPPSKITAFVDVILADDFRLFAENRESIISKFGLKVYADVMTTLAAGERYVNRAWSAAADGYVDEAADCIDRAIELLERSLGDLDEAEVAQE